MTLFEIIAIYIFILCLNIKYIYIIDSDDSPIMYVFGCIPIINIFFLGTLLYEYYIVEKNYSLYEIFEKSTRWIRNYRYKKASKLIQQKIAKGELDEMDPYEEENWVEEKKTHKRNIRI